jgi:hypothetical protein
LSTRPIAARTAALFVTSPLEWKTTTFGVRTPAPNTLRTRCPVSYAGLPGMAVLWYQRVESLPAATPPITVSTSQATITGQR